MPHHSFPHSCGFNISALVSPQLLACTVIWVQYLDFRFSSQQLLAFILGSVSNFPLSHLPLSHQFSAGTWLQSLHVPPFHLLACILSQYLNFPHPLPAFIFGSQNSPCVSQQSFACIFMYLYFVSMSRLHLSSLNNYLRSSCFNIELSLSPICPSISCIHFASYVDFPHWPLHHFLRFHCFNTGTSPASATSCMHLVSVSKFPHPVPGPKKRARVPKQKAPRSKNIQPNVSAYNNGVSPPTLWRQGPRSRCTAPKNRSRAQKQLIWLSKKIPGSSTNTCRSKQICRLGPKNMYRSKKRVPRSKKQASQCQLPIQLRPI